MRNTFVWLGLLASIAVPVILAASSPYLQWRGAIYIIAGFAGIFGLCLLLIQPLLAGHYLPNLSRSTIRNYHRYVGIALIFVVIVHVAGLWVTSPPDVVDVLLFRSPTPFAIWGALAMWAVFGTTILVLGRHKFRIKPRNWRLVHLALGAIIVIGTIVHALQIEGAMETVSKTLLCLLVLLAFLKLAYDVISRKSG